MTVGTLALIVECSLFLLGVVFGLVRMYAIVAQEVAA